MTPTMTKSMTAPMVALTIEPTKPANGTNPNCLNSQTPMKAPTMPMTMFQRSPKPKPRTICPASQPAIAPTISMMIMLSIPTTMSSRHGQAPASRRPLAMQLRMQLREGSGGRSNGQQPPAPVTSGAIEGARAAIRIDIAMQHQMRQTGSYFANCGDTHAGRRDHEAAAGGAQGSLRDRRSSSARPRAGADACRGDPQGAPWPAGNLHAARSVADVADRRRRGAGLRDGRWRQLQRRMGRPRHPDLAARR